MYPYFTRSPELLQNLDKGPIIIEVYLLKPRESCIAIGPTYAATPGWLQWLHHYFHALLSDVLLISISMAMTFCFYISTGPKKMVSCWDINSRVIEGCHKIFFQFSDIHQSSCSYLVEISPALLHNGSCSLQTQCSSRWCLLWASERIWWWPFAPGWRRCHCRSGWCKMDLYHSQWCRCILVEKLCTSHMHLIDQSCQYEPQGQRGSCCLLDKKSDVDYVISTLIDCSCDVDLAIILTMIGVTLSNPHTSGTHTI